MSGPFSRRRFLALAAAPALAAPQAEFSSAVNVVSLLVTVRDKKGMFVNQLAQEDFTVTEDGHPQTVAYFARQYDLPLTLGLLVDTSSSQTDVLPEELNASALFFKQVLRDGMDQAFLCSFEGRDYLLQNVTMARPRLETALDRLATGRAGRAAFGGTVLYDAVVDSAGLIMKRYQGRKALVLLTDGEDTSSVTSLENAVEASQRTDTVVYSIGIGTGLARGAGVLDTLSQKTGGRFFEVSRKQSVEVIYRTIEEELRSQYNLGYVPPPIAGKNRTGYHKVHVSVKGPGLSVRTREGYYSAG